jgi:hypothetical protein
MNTLTKKSFSGLTKTEQVVLVFNSGEKIMTRKNRKHFIQLYQLSDLFVEVQYDQSKKVIISINTTSKQSIILNYKVNSDELTHHV